MNGGKEKVYITAVFYDRFAPVCYRCTCDSWDNQRVCDHAAMLELLETYEVVNAKVSIPLELGYKDINAEDCGDIKVDKVELNSSVFIKIGNEDTKYKALVDQIVRVIKEEGIEIPALTDVAYSTKLLDSPSFCGIGSRSEILIMFKKYGIPAMISDAIEVLRTEGITVYRGFTDSITLKKMIDGTPITNTRIDILATNPRMIFYKAMAALKSEYNSFHNGSLMEAIMPGFQTNTDKVEINNKATNKWQIMDVEMCSIKIESIFEKKKGLGLLVNQVKKTKEAP